MKIKDMTDDELRTLIIDSLHQSKPQPAQPRTPRLVEAVEKLISRCQIIADNEQCDCEPEGHICGLLNFRREIDNVRLALAAEKERQELVFE